MLYRRALLAVLLLGSVLGWLLAGIGSGSARMFRVKAQREVAIDLQDEVIVFVMPKRLLLTYPPQGERRVFDLSGERVYRWHLSPPEGESALSQSSPERDWLRQF